MRPSCSPGSAWRILAAAVAVLPHSLTGTAAIPGRFGKHALGRARRGPLAGDHGSHGSGRSVPEPSGVNNRLRRVFHTKAPGSALVVIHMCQQPTGRSGLTRRAHQTRRSFGLRLFSASPRDTFLPLCPGLGGKPSSLLEKNQTENVGSEIVSKSRWLFFSLFHGIGATCV